MIKGHIWQKEEQMRYEYDSHLYRNEDDHPIILLSEAISYLAKTCFTRPLAAAALVTFCLLGYSLWPSQEYWAQIAVKKSVVTPEDRIDTQAALAEIKQIRQQIAAYGTRYGAFEAYAHEKRLVYYLRRTTSENLVNELALARKQSHTQLEYFMPDGAKDRNHGNFAKAQFKKFSKLTASDEFRKIFNWSPTTTEMRLKPLLEYWLSMLWLTGPLALVYYLLMIKYRGLKVRYELRMPLPLLVACAVPQIGVFVYPTTDPAKQLGRSLKTAMYFLAFTLSFGLVGTAKAQARGGTERPEEEDHTLVLKQQVEPPKNPATLTVWAWTDATGKSGHDRQVIWMLVKSGWVVLQQNRQTADYKTTHGNVTVGRSFQVRRNFSLLATLGPAFNYTSRQAGFKYDKLNGFVSVNLDGKQFRLGAFSKLLIPTDKEATFGHRHVISLRGPPERTPRYLKGLGLGFEFSQATRPARWIELMLGPTVNLGQVTRRPKSFWGKISVFPNYDFARGIWDMRVGYNQVFSLTR
jgi:hypothetical protein